MILDGDDNQDGTPHGLRLQPAGPSRPRSDSCGSDGHDDDGDGGDGRMPGRQGNDHADRHGTGLARAARMFDREGEQPRGLELFAAGVIHDLNTPVGVALTLTSHLAAEHQDLAGLFRQNRLTRAALERFLDLLGEGLAVMETNLGRSAELLRSCKQVSADGYSPATRRLDLAAYLRDIARGLAPLARRRGIALQVEGADGLYLTTRPGLLARVVANLVQNAVMHAFPKPSDKALIRLAAKADGEGHLLLRVADNGCGMADGVRQQAFTPFFTTRPGDGGSGLGLHIVRDLVTGPLGGTVELDSAPGRGTRFEIRLPVQQATAAEELPAPAGTGP